MTFLFIIFLFPFGIFIKLISIMKGSFLLRLRNLIKKSKNYLLKVPTRISLLSNILYTLYFYTPRLLLDSYSNKDVYIYKKKYIISKINTLLTLL